jgi:hypothetical protein
MHANVRRWHEAECADPGRIIGCVFAVLIPLSAGWLEKLHENAFALELCDAGRAVVCILS